MAIGIYQRLSFVFPRPIVQTLGPLLEQAGLKTITARTYLGFMLLLSMSLAFLAFFTSPWIHPDPLLQKILPPLAFLATGLGLYVLLLLQADARAKKIELMLPDALQTMSSNLRAGMTLENALWNAARPELGPLSEEIKRLSARTFGGTPVQTALGEMAQRVRSPLLRRAVKLMSEGITLGGQMAPLLDSVANDVRTQHQLRREIATSTLAYTLFIVFAAVIAAPLLFAVTTHYAEINEKALARQTKIETPQTAGQESGVSTLVALFSSTTKQSISSQDIRWFSIAVLLISAFFAAVISGLIRKGTALSGAPWILPFSAVSIGLYLGALTTLQTLLGVLIR